MSKLSQLSQREKIMLYGLALLLIVVGGIFLLIKPALARHDLLRQEMDELQIQRDAIEAVLLGLEGLEAEEARLQQELTDLGYLLSPVMTNEDLDHMLTGLLLEHQLTPQSLTLSDIGYVSIAPFTAGSLLPADSDQQEQEDTPMLLANVCNFTTSGARLHVLDLVDAIDKCTYLLLNNCTIAQQTDGFYSLNATVTVLFAEPDSVAGAGAENAPSLPPETGYGLEVEDLQELDLPSSQPEPSPLPESGGGSEGEGSVPTSPTPPAATTPAEGVATPAEGVATPAEGESGNGGAPAAPPQEGNTTPVAE